MSFLHWRRNVKCLLFSTFSIIFGYIILDKLWWPEDEYVFSDISEIRSDACVRPKLQLWPADIKEIYKSLTTVNCSVNEENWVYSNNGKFQISQNAINKHGPISCVHQVVRRSDGDVTIEMASESKPIASGDSLPADIISVKCAAKDGAVQSRIVLGIKPVAPVGTLNQETGLNLDIIMFGFDSVSSLTWQRSLQKSHEYFVNELNGVTLEGYNIVGDGTPQALLPILTGKREEELPEARRGFQGAKAVDEHPWIWKELRKRGYATQWGEDGANFGTFTYRMLGFNKQPVDHYMRPFYLVDKSLSKSCFGSIASHALQLNYMKEFLEVYGSERRKFSFIFHSDYSHDGSKLLQNADADVLQFLKWLNASKILDNALLILMSDHGPRFTNIRSTEQGKYEERLPYFSLRLPQTKSFNDKFPQLQKNLKSNSKVLTTPFDIHETLADVLNYSLSTSVVAANSLMPRPYPRGMSLFRKIPEDRLCQDASIESHWCTCMKWVPAPSDDPIVKRGAAKVVEFVNQMTSEFRGDCAELKLFSIKSANVVYSRRELLSFKGSKDTHGRIADFSDKMMGNMKLYQINLLTSPNNAEYEATLNYNIEVKSLEVSAKDISRLNVYGSQPNCIADQHPHLRQYCFCVNH